MSAQRIIYTEGSFEFDGVAISRGDLEGLVATARQQPRQKHTVRTGPNAKRRRRLVPVTVTVGGTVVTANYVTRMLQFVDRFGWFSDHMGVGIIAGHRFDWNEPTPGNWEPIEKELAAARLLVAKAKELRQAGLTKSADALLAHAGEHRFLADQACQQQFN